MNTWTPLWKGIVDSSIWDEPDVVCKVFLTMLALKDADHIYRGTAYALGKQSRKSEPEVLEALRVLSSPDTKRVEKQPFDGRRIKAVEEGWLILNGEKYRAQVSLEMKRARNRKAQQAWRDRKRSQGPIRGETRYVEALNNGEDAKAERIVSEGL
jgi:hypothetical protein